MSATQSQPWELPKSATSLTHFTHSFVSPLPSPDPPRSTVFPSFLWFPLTASLLSTGTRGLSLANAPGVVPLSSAQVRLFFSLLFFHLLTVSFPPPTFSLNLASPSLHLASHVPLSPRVAPRHASVASPPRRASPLSCRYLATRRSTDTHHPCRVPPSPRVALVSQYSHCTQSPLLHFCHPAATYVPFLLFFFLAPADCFSSLQVHRTPLSLASCEGGSPLLFSRRCALSAYKRIARHCRRLVRRFFFLFQVLMVPFSPIPRPFALRRLRLALPSPCVALASSCRLRRFAPSPRVALPSPCCLRRVDASLSTRCLCRVALAVLHCPLFKCCLRPVASPRPTFATRRLTLSPCPRLIALVARRYRYLVSHFFFFPFPFSFADVPFLPCTSLTRVTFVMCLLIYIFSFFFVW